MVRRKCVLRACPHHHYALEKIAGNTVKPHSFPRRDFPIRSKWTKFVKEHNGSLGKDKSAKFLCSAHFQPNLFNAEGTLLDGAVPTISPEFVRLLALKNGDISRPYPLPEKKKSKPSTPIVFLNDFVEGYNPQDQQLSSCQTSGSQLPKKSLSDLCACEFVCPVKTKVGVQIIKDTLRIWAGLGKSSEEEKVSSKALKGTKVEVVEKCKGNCYCKK